MTEKIPSVRRGFFFRDKFIAEQDFYLYFPTKYVMIIVKARDSNER